MFYSVQQVATVAGVSRIAVADAIRAGKLKAIKVGRAYIIEKENANNYIREREIKKIR